MTETEGVVHETLHHNEWLALKVMRAPAQGVNGYVYSHESRCQGRIIAILPYRDTPTGRQYLLRSEVTPCWSMHPTLSALTGGYEGGAIADDAVRELWEESGYRIAKTELIWLGQSFASKSADTVYELYTVDLTGRTAETAPGDGSILEDEASCLWLDDGLALADVLDPQVAVMHLRLQHRIAPHAPQNGEAAHGHH